MVCVDFGIVNLRALRGKGFFCFRFLFVSLPVQREMIMKRALYFLMAVCLLLASCTNKTSFVLEIPELTSGTIIVVNPDPEQIEAGQQDTLVFTEFDNGKFEVAFDSLQFKNNYTDCSVLIRTKEGKVVENILLPLEKGKRTHVSVKEVTKLLNKETNYLKINYSGNEYAEDFSEFLGKITGFEEMLLQKSNVQEKNDIMAKQALLYNDLLTKYPESGSAYMLLIGQLLNGDIRDENPITEYCDKLCLDVNYENKWANFLCNVVKERKKKALSSSVLSFTALDINEKTFTERDIKPHEYVLVCFWASWCTPCREEIPLLKELYKKYNKKGLEIVSISIDTNPAMWYEFAKANPLPWLSLIGDGQEITSRYAFDYIPMNIIADKEGKVIMRQLYGEEIRIAVSRLFDSKRR